MGVHAVETTHIDDLAGRQGQCTLLANVLLMTQHMLEIARGDNWQQVADLEGERRELLNECFASAVAPEHSEIFSEALAAMLHLNEELVSLLDSAKAEAAAKHAGQVTTHRQLNQYLDVETH